MPKPELLITQTNDVPKNRFYVVETKTPIDEGETLYAENTNVDFCGGENLADTWMGWGIVRMLVSAGKQAALIFRPEQNYTLPGGQDESE
jgi:hypothetical protein